MLEPRGYPCQNVDYIFAPPPGGSGNLQYVIGEQNKIYPLMSGHNTICAATAVLECKSLHTFSAIPVKSIRSGEQAASSSELQLRYLGLGCTEGLVLARLLIEVHGTNAKHECCVGYASFARYFSRRRLRERRDRSRRSTTSGPRPRSQSCPRPRRSGR